VTISRWPECAHSPVVASVKINPADDTPEGISLRPDGSARFTGFQVRTLITIAYRSKALQRFDQLIGAPTWVRLLMFYGIFADRTTVSTFSWSASS
jgi:hypothetical protein